MFDALRQMTPESVLFRLALAMLFGGMIGMERGRKGRAAGFARICWCAWGRR